MRKLAFLISLAALLFGGWYLASPWLAMKGIVDAAKDRDLAELEERIDFEQLREGTQAQMREAIDARTEDEGLLTQIGGAIAGELAESAIEVAVTPQGLANVVTVGGFTSQMVPEGSRGQKLSWDVERDGLDAFRGVSTYEDGSDGPVMVFERDGLGWDLVGVQLAEWE